MADSDTSAFQRYFGNKALKTFLPLSKRTFAILRDENLGRADLLFTTEGLTEVSPPNRIRKGRYSELLFEHGKAAIRFPDNHSYTIPTKCVDADTVDKILKALRAWDN